MDEETTVLEGQENTEGTPEVFDEGFDSDWDIPTFGDGQDDGSEVTEIPETDPEGEGAEADADQQEAEGNEGGEAGEGTEGEATGDEGSSDQGESFTLKHLGEETTVGRDEVVALAQKGMDYDRIRERWDGVKDDLPKLRMYEAFLSELAEARGGDIESLIDETRTRTLLAKAEARGETLEPAAAAAQAVRVRTSFTYEPAKPDPEKAEEEQQEKTNREVQRFLEEYRDVRAEEIPQEVWEENRKNGGDLVGAYRKYENKLLRDEVKQLKKQLEDREQKTKNKVRSTGSSKSEGSGKAKDPFSDGWDAMTF